MKLKYLILFLVIFIFLISACATQPATQPTQPVCNKPYILVGNDCCLDKDDNSICDDDEEVRQEPKTQKIEETKSESKIETKPTYTIGDVQTNINKALGEGTFEYGILEKSENSAEDFDFHTDDITATTFLTERGGGFRHYKVLEKFGIAAFDIKKERDYINNKDDFFDFVNRNTILLTSYLDLRKEAVIQESKDGQIHKSIESKQSKGVRINFKNISVTEEVIYDEINHLNILSDKIIEILKISLEDYELWYNRSLRLDKMSDVKFNMIGLSYLQAYSIHCSPSLIITIYADNYDEKNLDKPNINNYINEVREKMIKKAQSVNDMCENRYQFTYVRER